jgi:antagonist of KipI
MSLKILKAGILDTIQDPGRFGYQHLGVNPTGAMDQQAAAMANFLVGNPRDEAVIEMHFPTPVVLFDAPALIALSGADFGASIDGRPIPINHPVIVGENAVLRFTGLKSGSRCYLAIAGGLKLKKWLNSFSTNLKAGAGGLHGRKLQSGDAVETVAFAGDISPQILPWSAHEEPDSLPPDEILVLPGNEWNWMNTKSRNLFLQGQFVVTPRSDRMGYRLSGETLRLRHSESLVSSPVCFGVIQLFPDGQLVVLTAGRQTTGGYPRIAYAITAHRSKLAQMGAGDNIRFSLTDQQTAEELLLQQQHHLSQLEIACKLRLQSFLHEKH